MKWLSFVICLLSLNAVRAAPGGDVIGNGGDGVVVDGQLYLLDLVEFGNHKRPYIDANAKAEENDLATLSKVAHLPIDRALLAKKISEIRTISPILADSLVQAVRMYTWNLVDYDLVDVGDENTIVDLPRTQIAIRTRKMILINQTAIERLDAINRVALILHEVIYAMILPTRILDRREWFYQKSFVAREINAYLFSEDLHINGEEGLREKLQNPGTVSYYLPSWYWWEFASLRDQVKALSVAPVVKQMTESLRISYRFVVPYLWQQQPSKSRPVDRKEKYLFGSSASIEKYQIGCSSNDFQPKTYQITMLLDETTVDLKFEEILTPSGRQIYLRASRTSASDWFGASRPDLKDKVIRNAEYVAVPGKPGHFYESGCVKFLSEILRQVFK